VRRSAETRHKGERPSDVAPRIERDPTGFNVSKDST
jgi:hypothetical protein